ncbi:NADH:ubiquinone reductase (H(+)-translocating) [Ranunculus cassubicifolius]
MDRRSALYRTSSRAGNDLQPIREMSSNMQFTLLGVCKQLQLTKAKDRNFSFSPCSMQLALCLLANGARGSTLSELLALADVKSVNKLKLVASKLVRTLTQSTYGGPEISFVGGVWADKSVSMKPEFKFIAQDVYKMRAKVVDFRYKANEVVDKVNNWAEDVTDGHIKHLLPENQLDEETNLVLANAVYFKGKWCNPFEKSATKNHYFSLLNGDDVKVPFMTNYKAVQYIKTCDDFRVLRLPYENSALSMYIILPNNRDGLWALAEKVSFDPLFLENYVTPDIEEVRVGKVRVPKFKISYSFDASKILEYLGLRSCFGEEAEFNELVQNLRPGEWFGVDGVYQESCIEVSEEGTEAAAVNSEAGCGRPITGVDDFVADHPFMYVIRDDNTGMVLFMGHVVDPSSE